MMLKGYHANHATKRTHHPCQRSLSRLSCCCATKEDGDARFPSPYSFLLPISSTNPVNPPCTNILPS